MRWRRAEAMARAASSRWHPHARPRPLRAGGAACARDAPGAWRRPVGADSGSRATRPPSWPRRPPTPPPPRRPPWPRSRRNRSASLGGAASPSTRRRRSWPHQRRSVPRVLLRSSPTPWRRCKHGVVTNRRTTNPAEIAPDFLRNIPTFPPEARPFSPVGLRRRGERLKWGEVGRAGVAGRWARRAQRSRTAGAGTTVPGVTRRRP